MVMLLSSNLSIVRPAAGNQTDLWQHIVAVTATIDGPDLNQVSAFVQVVEARSFTEAARALGLPKSSVSRRVSALEKSLRVRLLQRSTRKLVPTEAGRLYFERARAALAGLSDAGAAVTDMSREIAGPIRFTTGGDNTGFLVSLFGEFLARYPKVQLDVVLTPRRVDLLAEGFDLALRAGPLVDSSLIVRRIGRTDHHLFASRAYLRKAGTPRRVSDLASHRFILFGEAHQRDQIRLTGPDGEETVKIGGPLIVHDIAIAADAAAAGIGIALVPDAYFGWAIRAGLRARRRDLVRLLPDHGLPGAELNLVSPPVAYEPVRVGLFRDFLAERLRPVIQLCALAEEKERVERRKTEAQATRKTEAQATREAARPVTVTPRRAATRRRAAQPSRDSRARP
jgi:DNA-binding transcriptional LysR family regulator